MVEEGEDWNKVEIPADIEQNDASPSLPTPTSTVPTSAQSSTEQSKVYR